MVRIEQNWYTIQYYKIFVIAIITVTSLRDSLSLELSDCGVLWQESDSSIHGQFHMSGVRSKIVKVIFWLKLWTVPIKWTCQSTHRKKKNIHFTCENGLFREGFQILCLCFCEQTIFEMHIFTFKHQSLVRWTWLQTSISWKTTV